MEPEVRGREATVRRVELAVRIEAAPAADLVGDRRPGRCEPLPHQAGRLAIELGLKLQRGEPTDAHIDALEMFGDREAGFRAVGQPRGTAACLCRFKDRKKSTA